MGEEFRRALYRTVRLDLLRSKEPELLSLPDESERDFRVRLAISAREARDAAVEAARKKTAPKVESLEERIRRAEAKVEAEKQQASSRKLETAISIGSTVLGALFGRRKLSSSTFGRAATSARSASRSMKEARDVELAAESVEALREKLAALETEVQADLAEVAARFDPSSIELETQTVKPRKSDVQVRRVVLAWLPSGRPIEAIA